MFINAKSVHFNVNYRAKVRRQKAIYTNFVAGNYYQIFALRRAMTIDSVKVLTSADVTGGNINTIFASQQNIIYADPFSQLSIATALTTPTPLVANPANPKDMTIYPLAKWIPDAVNLAGTWNEQYWDCLFLCFEITGTIPDDLEITTIIEYTGDAESSY